MISMHSFYNGSIRFCLRALLLGSALCLFVAPLRVDAQSVPPQTFPLTLTSQNERGLAKILASVQHVFLTPITFEEIPYENAAELPSTIIIKNGEPQVRLVNPVTDFSVTLNAGDGTPLLATRVVLSAYTAANRPGVYTAFPVNNRVDVVPTQMIGANGALKTITPLMSQPITFPLATRSIDETLQLLVQDVSRESGYKVVLLDVPGSQFETVEAGSSGLPARDVIAQIGTSLNRQVSFQCLYDVGTKTYYLNVMAVVPDSVPGRPPQQGPIKVIPEPKTGPANSPFFIKK